MTLVWFERKHRKDTSEWTLNERGQISNTFPIEQGEHLHVPSGKGTVKSFGAQTYTHIKMTMTPPMAKV